MLPHRNRDIKVEQMSQFAVGIETFGVFLTWIPKDERISVRLEPIFVMFMNIIKLKLVNI